MHLLFPFPIEDVCPSLYSTEFVYASKEKCNVYSVTQEKVSHSIEIPLHHFSNHPISLQPSSHPLIYYLSHSDGLMSVDLRMPSPTLLHSHPHLSHLRRIVGDWNHFLVATDNRIGIVDIRNPVVNQQTWRYRGELRELNCSQTKDSNHVDYHILTILK